MQSSHKTDLQGHSNVSSNNWMARPTQQHWPLASPAQLQLWVSPFRPAAATSISAFDDITRKERIRRKTMQSSHKTDIQGHSNVSSNNWMARPTQQHWPLASPAQLQVWVPPFRPAAARSISAFDDITSHYSLQQLFRPWQALRHLILHMRRQYFEDCKRINHY